MTFTTRTYLKYLIPVPIIFGLILFIWIIYSYRDMSEVQKDAAIWTSLIIFLFFFGLPYWTFKYLKIINVNNGIWTIRYPYLRRTIKLTRDNVHRIEIIENISGPHLPTHNQINIRVRNSDSIYINSMETKEFDKLCKLISTDFRDIIQHSNFWTGRKKN